MVWPVSSGHIVLIPKVSVAEGVGEGREKYPPPHPRAYPLLMLPQVILVKLLL